MHEIYMYTMQIGLKRTKINDEKKWKGSKKRDSTMYMNNPNTLC